MQLLLPSYLAVKQRGVTPLFPVSDGDGWDGGWWVHSPFPPSAFEEHEMHPLMKESYVPCRSSMVCGSHGEDETAAANLRNRPLHM